MDTHRPFVLHLTKSFQKRPINQLLSFVCSSINQRPNTSTTIAMAEADLKLTTVSKDGAKLGSVIPQEAMSKGDGKALLPGDFSGVGDFKGIFFETWLPSYWTNQHPDICKSTDNKVSDGV